MNILIIDDHFETVNEFKKFINNSDYSFYPESEEERKILFSNLFSAIDLFKSIPKNEADNYISSYIEEKNIRGIILDYKLDGNNKNLKFTGSYLYKNYLCNITSNINYLFFTFYDYDTEEYKKFDSDLKGFKNDKNCDWELEILNKNPLIDENEDDIKLLKSTFYRIFPIKNKDKNMY